VLVAQHGWLRMGVIDREARRNGPRGRGAWRRNALGLMACFAVVASGVLWVAPGLRRTYVVRGELPVGVRAVEGMEGMGQLPEEAVKETAAVAGSAHVQVALAAGGGEERAIQLEASGPSRAEAWALVQAVGDQVTMVLRHRAEERVTEFRAGLGKEADRLAAREEEASHAVEAFRLAHRGVLPDDPNSVTGQLEKLSGRLEDKQQRLQIVTAQIERVQAYQKKGAAGSAPPPPALAPASADAGASVAAHAESDPEVLSLTAQMQLLNDQVDDQLNNKHRTEQHPYVVDLREQQAALQKKLDAAKQRVAAGQPPPAVVRAPVPSANGSTVAAAQAVDFQLQALEAERDALGMEIPALTAQREALQKQVEGILPIRQAYEQLTGDLAGVQKEREGLAGRTEAFNRVMPAQGAAGVIEVEPLVMAAGSGLPEFPRVPVVYGGAVALAAGVTGVLAWMLAKADRALHSAEETAGVLDLPIAGAIVELRTRRQELVRRLWRGVVRPVVAMALVAMMVGSGVLCYRHLADANFLEAGSGHSIGSMISAGLGIGGGSL
jgi:hypothetical protein